MDTVVQARDIHSCSKPAFQGSIHTIHTLCDRAGWIQLVTDVLQVLGYFHTFGTPLFRYFISDTPHHDRRMVTVVEYQIRDILIAPFLEEPGIAIFAFR